MFSVHFIFHVTFSKPLNTESKIEVLKLKCCFHHLTFPQFSYDENTVAGYESF